MKIHPRPTIQHPSSMTPAYPESLADRVRQFLGKYLGLSWIGLLITVSALLMMSSR